MADPTRAAEIARLRAAISTSGLSVNQYARTVLVRSPRTIRRWLAGDRGMPEAVLDYLNASMSMRLPTTNLPSEPDTE